MAAPDVHLCGNICCGVVLSAPLLRCSKCHRVCYCCRACQTQAWKAGHKRDCGQVAAVRRVQGELTNRQKELCIKVNNLYTARNWRGLVALEATVRAAAAQLRETRPDFIAEIYGMLGTGCSQLGQYTEAIELSEQGLAIAVEAGDRLGERRAYITLGGCYKQLGQYAKAIKLHEQSLAISEEMSDRAGQGVTCSDLGCCYEKLGQYDTAIDLHEQCLKIKEEMGDRASQGATFSNLGVCYESLQQYDTAIGLLEKAKLILQEVGNRVGEAQTLAGLGRCKTALGKYAQAITCHTEQWAITQELDLEPDQTSVALYLGVVVWAQARVEHGNAATAFTTPSASGHPAAYMDSMRDAAQWFRTASCLAQTHGFVCENESAQLHLSFLAFDTGEEEEALVLLKKYLQAQVDSARSFCRGCCQQRGDDAPMLTCGGCSVARFCNEDHQRMASKKGGRKPVRHKDVCSLLRKWRQVVKGKATAESCSPDLLAFLRRDLWWRCHAPVEADFRAGARD